MDKETKLFVALLAFLLMAIAVVATLLVGQRNDVVKAEAARQVQIEAFYRNHKCSPLGYVATKYEPVRTYQCDNGVFIPRDMAR